MAQELAIVFPGQGSQSIGMLADVAKQYPEFLDCFANASDVLGYDLWSLIQNGPEDKLNATEYTQPALLVASYALWQLLIQTQQVEPAMLAGHSLGEYTALLCANSLEFADAVKLVATRGRLMQEAVAKQQGAMAAIIGLDDDAVSELCQSIKQQGEILAPANFNSVGQVVVAGHHDAIERLINAAKPAGAKMAIMLPVSVPSHCELMLPAAAEFKSHLQDIKITAPIFPVVNNVDVAIYTDEAEIKNALLRQLSMPVRWVETIQYFVSQGITQVLECGPGKVLTGLNKRIDKRLQLKTANELLVK